MSEREDELGCMSEQALARAVDRASSSIGRGTLWEAHILALVAEVRRLQGEVRALRGALEDIAEWEHGYATTHGNCECPEAAARALGRDQS